MRVHHEQRTAIRAAVAAAAARLEAAGIDSARVDAEELAAHAAGIARSRLALLDAPDADFFERFDALVAARSRRVPLQHLTGCAPFGPLLLQVGPGVFIPRPETESLLEWAVNAGTADGVPADLTIVDLCTGSGALAIALARQWPAATVLAVDDSPAALRYARRNADGTGVDVVEADVTQPGLLPALNGLVDLVVANPPYIPAGANLEPEVAEHDPHHALFGGPDGMTVVAAVVDLAARWLRPGGRLGVEHDDTTSAQTFELVLDTGLFHDIESRRDLAGRPRFVTAVRAGATGRA
jgi:release factor glutamine methyltransferase